MTSAELYQWMADPSLLNKSSLQELKQMVDDFPYFHAVRILYLKNLAVLNDVCLNKELKRMSIYIPDRKRLFLLVNDRRFVVSESEKQLQSVTPVKKTENAFNIVLAKTAPAPVPSVVATSDYVNWLDSNIEDLPAIEGTENRMKHQDLIDSFIKNEGDRFARRLDTSADNKASDSENESEKSNQDIPEKMSLDDSYFTETLARVYINQKRYDKALEIIRSLSLKYPEKNIYFADQIRYLEKIINIKK